MTSELAQFRKSADFYLGFFKQVDPSDRDDLLSEMTVLYLEREEHKRLSVRFCYLQALDKLYPRRGKSRERELTRNTSFDRLTTRYDVQKLREKLASKCHTVYFAMLILDERLERVRKKTSLRDSNLMWDYFVEGLTIPEISVKHALDKSKISRVLVKALNCLE